MFVIVHQNTKNKVSLWVAFYEAFEMIENFLRFLNVLGSKKNDDFVDRLHYVFASNALIGAAVLISWKQFGGDPVECILPARFPDTWSEV